ncbi:DUF4340 domain-containing protein [Bdellovibrio sp. HCB337]|uniref:DUF4340 domain-containing protein n=1 Tax=Bdellovibrio sp. HCB337 TaxID=3394358 RepID=UPI0039A535B6
MKKTSWFAIFVAVLVAGTYYVEFYQANKTEQTKAEESKVVSFPAEQIHQIEIENKLGKVLLKRDADGWTLVEPIKDWADNQFTEDFVNGLASEKSIDVAAEGENINWSVYGLDKDVSKVAFTNQQGTSQLITVSDKKNFEGNSFLRRGNENKVLVATSQWALRTQKAPLEFRDKRLFRGKISSVEGIQIKSIKDEFALVQKDNKWISEKHPDLKLDQNKIREVLTSLNEVRASEFLNTLPASVAKAKIGLKLTDKSWSAEIKQAADKSLYAVVSDPAFILKVDPGQMDKFLGMTLMGLRDRKEPFDFQNLLVRHIEISTPIKKLSLQKDQETWKLVGDDKAGIDQGAVRAFIARLSDSAVTEYLEKSEQGAYKGADSKIVLKDEKQKVLYEISWGPVYKKKALVGEKTLILAQSSLFKDVFGLDQSVVESWGLMNLLPVDQNKVKEPKEHP